MDSIRNIAGRALTRYHQFIESHYALTCSSSGSSFRSLTYVARVTTMVEKWMLRVVSMSAFHTATFAMVGESEHPNVRPSGTAGYVAPSTGAEARLG